MCETDVIKEAKMSQGMQVKQERKNLADVIKYDTETERTDKLKTSEGTSEWNGERQSGWKGFCVWDNYLLQRNFNCIPVKALMV